MKYAGIAIAALASLTVMSGMVNINFQHNVHVPVELSNGDIITQRRAYNLTPPFIHTVSDVRMKDEIKGTDSVKRITKVLQEAGYGDKVIFHIAGFGGVVDSVALIINNIKATKAYVVMSVEAPVYSGHAFLALFGHELKVSPYAFLMYHSTSGVDIDCSKETGTDRGQPTKDKCEAYKNANLTLFSNMLVDAPILTKYEKIRIMQGHDVYVQPSDVETRIFANEISK